MIRIRTVNNRGHVDQQQSNVLFQKSDTALDPDVSNTKEQRLLNIALSPNTAQYKCPRCSMIFRHQYALNLHLAALHNEAVLVCNECGTAFSDVSLLQSHRLEHKRENRTVRLAQERVDATVSTQNTEQPTQIPEDLNCNLCDKTFTTIGGLKYHLRTHTNVKPFICPFCERKFITNVNLNAHVRVVHSTVKPYECEQCTQRFASIDHLKKHTTSVHWNQRNFVCNVCQKAFLQQSHLTQHQWTHTDVKQHQCELCANAYTSKTSLRKHTLKQHAITES